MIKCVKKTCSTNFHNTIFSQYTPKGIWDAIVKKPKYFEMFYYQSNVSGPFAHAVRRLGFLELNPFEFSTLIVDFELILVDCVLKIV